MTGLKEGSIIKIVRHEIALAVGKIGAVREVEGDTVVVDLDWSPGGGHCRSGWHCRVNDVEMARR
jgi:hypothetical protein